MTRTTAIWLRVTNVLCLSSAFAALLLAVGTVQAGEPITRDAAAPPVAAVSQAVETAPAPTVESRLFDVESECADKSTPTEASTSESVAAPATAESTTQAAGCKPCKDRTWCKCTYNGMPRASCNPCCYVNNIGVLTCLD